MTTPNRNDPCPCGSGKKYKKCCLGKAAATPPRVAAQTASQAIQLALQQHQAGRLPQAEALYRQVLQGEPDHPDALHLLGMLVHQAGDSAGAVELINHAIRSNPANPVFHFNLGTLYRTLNRPDEAAACYQKALALRPDFVEALNNLGNVFKEQGRLDEALTCYQKAHALRPDFVEALNNLGNVFKEQGRLDEALACYQKVLGLVPDRAEVYENMGNVYQDQGNKLEESMARYRQALALAPEFHAVRSSLLHQLQNACAWESLEENIKLVRQVVREAPATATSQINPFAFLALPGATALEQKRCSEKWAQVQFQPLVAKQKIQGFAFRREANPKIRLGYLSADFHDHATARLMAEVFELHDRSRFHITAYSYGPNDGSAMRGRLQQTFDRFVNIRGDSDEGAAGKIHADHIDILIDLKGYTKDTRSAILALRPAPVQVNYLGYPGTLGADFVDYLIADRFIIPPEHFGCYTEKVLWLPDCYQPNDRTRPRLAAPSREECSLPQAGVVFCCFNQTYKITPGVFDVWCRLLRAVPGSVLWLLASNPQAEGNLRREAESRGGRMCLSPALRAP